jgi:heme exporter protein A
LSEPLLSFDALACRRGDRLLWRGASAVLRAGDALYVSGANGLGKSSLLRVLAGLLPQAAGTVARSARSALIDETLALDRALPLAEALLFWARLDGGTRASVLTALDRLGVAHLAPVPVRILSTGQKKRAGLARVLAADAPLWLLDEPANGLDRDGVVLLEGLMAAHRAAGGAIVLASHQQLQLGDAATLDLAELAL